MKIATREECYTQIFALFHVSPLLAQGDYYWRAFACVMWIYFLARESVSRYKQAIDTLYEK